MVVQSAIASEGSEELSNVASVFDVAPLHDIDQVFDRAHASMEASLRARQCEPQTGGCHLTTVCCGMAGLADDCWELRTLRAFRDGWLVHQEGGRADIARYYQEAPKISRALAGDPRAARRVYLRFILPSAVMAYLRWNRAAWEIYRRGAAHASNRCRT
ncbi:CFI-box-CTERM domain-containing protein [Palleronia abyssalis]|nr:CFI-box-CTERM domain-containing protein [Palleronia abyssalis]